jgi:hypothetical protein
MSEVTVLASVGIVYLTEGWDWVLSWFPVILWTGLKEEVAL